MTFPRHVFWIIAVLGLWTGLLRSGADEPVRRGDLDGDGVASVRDLARLTAHIKGTRVLTDAQLPLADLDGDGALATADLDLLVAEILGVRQPEELPLSTVRLTSPAAGEDEVGVTRETVVHLSIPLAPGSAMDASRFFAEFAGRQLHSRVEVAGDGAKVTLFYLEPLPANARVQVTFDGDGLLDLRGRPVDADGDGQPGGVFRFTYDTLAIHPVDGTAVIGRVFASQPGAGQAGPPVDIPLPGVTVTVDGAEETLRAVTDANGNFTLGPCPAGAFFVHVDGRTSPLSQYPNGRYYPTVGKQWYAVAGRTDNPASDTGTIYLPEIRPGTLVPVSATENTRVAFPPEVLTAYPELTNTWIEVPANSLFADDGARGGRVGIAPVPPQRLPEPLPPGLELPLVITIQTDGGLNFDQPVPLCLPNLPDPATGQTLPPGAASALWSFNHDLGHWEVVGSMTVSADGLFVKTDPGVGVRQPGWHGTRPGAQASGEGPVLLEPDPSNADPSQNEPDCSMVWSSTNVVAVAYSVFKEGSACVIGLLELDTAWKCLHAMVTTSIDLMVSVSKFQGQMNEGLVSWKGAKEFLAHAKAIKARLTAYEGNCIEDLDATPASLAENMFNCLGNVLNIGGSVCDVVDPEEGGLPPECQPGVVTRAACATLRQFKSTHEKIASIVAFIKSYEDQFKLAVLCFTLDRLEDFVNGMIPPPGAGQAEGGGGFVLVGNSDRPLTPGEIAELNVLLTDTDREAGLFVAAGGPYPELSSNGEEVRRGFDRELQRLSAEIGRRGRPVTGISYWLIEIGGTELRGRVAPKGRINAILGPNLPYTLRVYNPSLNRYDSAPGFSAPNGRSSVLSATLLDGAGAPLPDFDGDGVPDPAEAVLGTNPAAADTDGDGVSDRAEALQGTDPLGGVALTPGLAATIPGLGAAEDVSAINDIAVTANGPSGVTVYNVFSGLNPVRIASLDTPGSAVAVSAQGTRVAVADYSGGLAVLDIANPLAVRLVRQISFGDPVTAVASGGPTAYAGTAGGKVYAVDLFTGAILGSTFLGAGAVQDLALCRETLYALQPGTLRTLRLDLPSLAVHASVASTGPANGSRRSRLFAGERVVYATWRQGFNIFDVSSTPHNPVFVRQVSTTQLGWKHIVNAGSGLGLAAVGLNVSSDGPHHLDLYSVGADGQGSAYITTFATPGLASAVAVYNGMAHVADGWSGLSVVRHRPGDTAGVPPTISLEASVSLAAGIVEEGGLLRISALATDDVQVRQVRFYVDGALALTDGGYPFEFRFVTPPLSNGTVTVRAQAEDTGGNTAWSPLVTLTLLPDTQPPQFDTSSPSHNEYIFPASEVWARFNEPMDEDSLVNGGITLNFAGADQAWGTSDDQTFTNGVLRFRDASLTAFLSYPSELPAGRYRLAVSASALDLAGNALANPAQIEFRMVSDLDTDGDGVPDDWEALLGLDPADADTDNDGIPDGREDFDADGVANAVELRLRLNPRLTDSDSDGVADGAEDFDADGLANNQESTLGTDPALVDSDGDRLDDFTENATGSDPLDADSGTRHTASALATFINALPSASPGTLAGGTSVAARRAAYVNALNDSKPATVATSVAVPITAWLNSPPEPKPASVPTSTAAPVISYQNP